MLSRVRFPQLSVQVSVQSENTAFAGKTYRHSKWHGAVIIVNGAFIFIKWMYKRYVDDINVIVNATRPGLKFVDSVGRVVLDESVVEQERAVKADRRCMALVQKIGNSIHPSIQLEVDFPSKHDDDKLPILDLKVWVEMRRQQDRGEEESEENVVLHEFYSKDVASKCVINARSALSWSCKRTILTQEVLRILLNCSRELPWKTVVGHINHMMLRLQYSGYDQKFSTGSLQPYDRIRCEW